MDQNQGTAPGSAGSGSSGAASPDPREELRDQLQIMGRAAGELLEQLVKVPVTLAQIPLQALPEDTATHARNAATEGFAAVRTLLDTMSRGIDEMLREQRERMANMGSTHTGVGGASSPTTTPPADSTAGTGTRALDAGDTTGAPDSSGLDAGDDVTRNGGDTTRLV